MDKVDVTDNSCGQMNPNESEMNQNESEMRVCLKIGYSKLQSPMVETWSAGKYPPNFPMDYISMDSWWVDRQRVMGSRFKVSWAMQNSQPVPQLATLQTDQQVVHIA